MSFSGAANGAAVSDRLIFRVDHDFGVHISVDGVLVIIVVGLVFALILMQLVRNGVTQGRWKSFEVDEAEFGLGEQKITLRPNYTDRQIAYQIWVELSTRKIGLPIDLEDDVIFELYDSWYQFFSVTRELIKDVPVSKFRRKDTEKIIRLSIDVLNLGIRPHLTRWQSRFRRWYERVASLDENLDLSPQEIQTRFPQYQDLKKDILLVNGRLMQYRSKMYELVSGL